jgi:hypothetical protein
MTGALAMPRYFFHLRDQHELHEDEEGIDLPDVEAVLEEALRTDRELDREPAGIYGLELEIADSEGRTVLKVPVQERRRGRSSATRQFHEDEHRRSTDVPKIVH